jgi:hypothetical protein
MQGNVTLIALGAIALGIVQCLFGYRIFRVILGITGFILGGLIAGYLVFNLTESQLFALIAGILGGLIGAGLMAGLYVVGIFVIGAIFGGMAAAALLSLGGNSPQAWVVVILAIAGGVLAVILQKPMIVIATSFLGAWLAVTGIAAIAGSIVIEAPRELLGSLSAASTVWLIGWFVLGIVGVFFQYRRARS